MGFFSQSILSLLFQRTHMAFVLTEEFLFWNSVLTTNKYSNWSKFSISFRRSGLIRLILIDDVI